MKKFLAIYLGSANPSQTPADLDQETIGRGMAAWGEWVVRNAPHTLDTGGPLGKTKRVGAGGVSDVRNLMAGYVIVEAADHEAAASLFEDHPHFTIFPGEAVEIMECLPIPTGP